MFRVDVEGHLVDNTSEQKSGSFDVRHHPYDLARRVLKKDSTDDPDAYSVGRTYLLSESDLARWELVSKAILRFDLSQDLVPSVLEWQRLLYGTVSDRVRNWSLLSQDFRGYAPEDALFILLVISIAGLLYGGLHLLA